MKFGALKKKVDDEGFASVPSVLADSQVDRLGSALAAKGTRALRRNLLGIPDVSEVAHSESVRALVEEVLGSRHRIVRAILFDKTPSANWKVVWHQDLSIPVSRRIDVAEFSGWTVKAGVQHVQPPASILNNMIAVRLHLDDCSVENGPLRVIPGSHAHGRLDDSAIESWKTKPAVTCAVGRGGALLMRPLLLHASSPATVAGHRRVVHLEFAGCDLPGGLQWAQA